MRRAKRPCAAARSGAAASPSAKGGALYLMGKRRESVALRRMNTRPGVQFRAGGQRARWRRTAPPRTLHRVLLLAPLVALALAAPPAAARPPAELLRALAEAPPGGARAAAATRPLLGARYLRSALGEGSGPAPGPRFRLDAFDCLSFVETAVALGSSGSLAEAERALDDVRYQGPPDLAARNHEVQAQWIPSNLARGWIAEAPEVAGERGLRLARDQTEASWAAAHRAGRAIAGLPRAREPLGHFETAAVAPGDLAEAAARIPEGAVVFVLRQDQPGRSTRVSHAGLVVLGPSGERRVRHATSTPGIYRVIEEPLLRFAVREARAFPRWPVAGYAFFALPDASARVATLVRGGAGAAAP
jgi:hypothetical protein